MTHSSDLFKYRENIKMKMTILPICEKTKEKSVDSRQVGVYNAESDAKERKQEHKEVESYEELHGNCKRREKMVRC